MNNNSMNINNNNISTISSTINNNTKSEINRRKSKKGDDKSIREFYIANKSMNDAYKYTNNFIKTSHYTMINFLPKCLLLQFKRYANIYFLIIAILQCISIISPLNPFSAIAPLLFVLCLSILREGYEDINRHKSDQELNSSKCLIYQDGKFELAMWKNINIGDIVKICDTEFFPADLIIIDSSNENGACYIETSSLDGEKNLKPKNSPKETIGLYDPNNPLIRLEGKVSCQQPNSSLYMFEGIMTLHNDQNITLGAKQLLLRGAKLKNTEWIIGVVTYTGIDTKIMKNSESGRNKTSNIEVITNNLTLKILIFQLAICLTSAIGCLIWDYKEFWPNNHYLYLNAPYGSGLDAFISFWSYILLNNTMVPISLIVSLELVKSIQAYFIEKDDDIYNKNKDRYAKVLTSSINEELGQVEYVFSDKTGTLTCNIMEFKICLIGNEMYGDSSIIMREGETIKQKLTFSDNKSGVDYTFHDKNLTAYITKTQQVDPDVNLKILSIDSNNQILHEFKKQSDLIREFLLLLSICHDCLLDKSNENITYQGPSPDEITLVDAASRLGYQYLGGSQNFKKINILGDETNFEILQIFEFDSNRKRMSVIFKDQGKIKIFMKGADNIVISRLRTNSEQPYLKKTKEKLGEFSKRGLRTLCMAMRVISENEYNEFDYKYKEVISLTCDKESKENLINKLIDNLEKELYLIGATAVEDKLQDNVPETIYDMIKANIKVWMLTGDKLETAENIGRSCNLIQQDFHVLQISENSKVAVIAKLDDYVKKYDDLVLRNKKCCLLIDGESLAITLNDIDLKDKLLYISKGCNAVICCRVTPKQKADVVRMVKNGLGKITLSIGDGANDVNMIQEAHIGIGIYGQEGMRAVQSSDYAIPEFQGLWRLLFVHGRWSYIRISEMILYFFYKNILFTCPQFYFSFLCGFSGQSIFDDWYITFYNLIFTALPLVLRAIFDQDVYYKRKKTSQIELSEKSWEILPYLRKYYPLLYEIGQKNELFTPSKFYFTVFQSLIQGAFIFCLCVLSMPISGFNNKGHDEDLWYFSITLYTVIIWIVDIKLAIYTRYWTILTFFALIVTSLGFYYGYIWLSDQVVAFSLYKTAEILFDTTQFYLIVFLGIGIIFLTDYSYVCIKAEYGTSIIDLFNKIIKKNKQNDENAFKAYLNIKDTDSSKEIESLEMMIIESKPDISISFINTENEVEEKKMPPFHDTIRAHSPKIIVSV